MAKIIGYHSDNSPCYTDGCKLGHINKQTVSQSLQSGNVSAFLEAKTEQDKVLPSDFQADTADDFASSWASDKNSQRLELQAKIDENDGKHEFTALFDLNGNRINAFPVQTKYGQAWMVCDANGSSTGEFLNPSKAKNPERAKAANAKKNIYVGKVMSPAYVRMEGNGTGMSGAHTVRPVLHQRRAVDPADIEVLDNGSNPDGSFTPAPVTSSPANKEKKEKQKSWKEIDSYADNYPAGSEGRAILDTLAGYDQEDTMSTMGAYDYFSQLDREAENGDWDPKTVNDIRTWYTN